jgi:competence protein ComEA
MRRMVAGLTALLFAVGALTASGAFAQAPKDAAKDAPKGTTDAAKDTTKKPLVDINTATEAELKALPGVGDA